MPPAWTVVVGTDDLDARLAHARDLSGTVVQAPMSIPGGARVAVLADPTGAVLALMESPSDEGMVWGEPGAVCWVDCLSRDPAASRHFYEQLFGWASEEDTTGYLVFNLDGERFGGLMAMPPDVPAEAPSYWLVYFAADVAATCARAAELGGRVLESTHEIGDGRFAVLADPAGAVFAVLDGFPG
jgi:predicted enzyme related to lactoylglutathione lyase